MGTKELRKILKSAVTDDFENGTVIRWTSAGLYNYAAIKSPRGWFTTAAGNNPFAPMIASFDKMVEILSRSETSNVAVASSWESVR